MLTPSLRLFVVSGLALVAAAVAGCTGVPSGVTPVTGFDAERYMGRWYEIARLDHSFERGLTNVTATYELQGDGSVRVINRGFDPRVCEYRERVGKARFTGSPDVASLAVTFFGPFEGGYHVIELAADYSYAVVSGPTRGFLWVLSRTPAMDEAVLSRIVASASANGYPAGSLIRVDQSGAAC